MTKVITPSFQINTSQYSNAVNKNQKKAMSLEKQDNVELSVKPEISKKKKALITFGVAVGTATVITGLVTLIRKGKAKNEGRLPAMVKGAVKKVQSDAQNIQNSAKGIQKTAQELQNSAQELQEKANGVQTSARNIIDETLKSLKDVEPSEDGTKVIKKLSDDGKTLMSRSTQRGEFLTIDNFIEKTCIEARNGELTAFSSGVEYSGSYIKRQQERFYFVDGILSEFHRGIEHPDMKQVKVQESFIFKDRALEKVQKGYRYFADGSENMQECFVFQNEKINEFSKGYEHCSKNGLDKTQEVFRFKEDGMLSEFNKGQLCNTDGAGKTEEIYLFNKGKLDGVAKGCETSSDGSMKAVESFSFENGKLMNWIKHEPDNKVKA